MRSPSWGRRQRTRRPCPGTKDRGATSLSLLSVTLHLLPFGRSKEGAGRSRGDGGLFIGVSSKKEKAELSLGKMSGKVADDG